MNKKSYNTLTSVRLNASLSRCNCAENTTRYSVNYTSHRHMLCAIVSRPATRKRDPKPKLVNTEKTTTPTTSNKNSSEGSGHGQPQRNQQHQQHQQQPQTTDKQKTATRKRVTHQAASQRANPKNPNAFPGTAPSLPGGGDGAPSPQQLAVYRNPVPCPKGTRESQLRGSSLRTPMGGGWRFSKIGKSDTCNFVHGPIRIPS